MSVELCCVSHSPLLGLFDPPADVLEEAMGAVSSLREQVQRFDPELVVIFGPDHLNGFRYDVLPQFCVGTAAAAIGDYGTLAGDLDVPAELATRCLEAVLAAGVDAGMSARMSVDHAFAQPLEHLVGGLAAVPVIPVFINAAAPPLGPISRTRALGAAIGAWLATLDRRVLVVGSGGLSHDPPAPSLQGADAATFDRLVNGMCEEDRPARQQAAIDAARRFSAGEPVVKDLAPEFDVAFQSLLAEADFDSIDRMGNDWLTEHAGKAVHEIRSWVAAFAALRAAEGAYQVGTRYYRPIPEWIVGFGAMSAAAPAR